MEFINPQEKYQLRQILTKSSQLQTADERSNLLTFCGLKDLGRKNGYVCQNTDISQTIRRY